MPRIGVGIGRRRREFPRIDRRAIHLGDIGDDVAEVAVDAVVVGGVVDRGLDVEMPLAGPQADAAVDDEIGQALVAGPAVYGSHDAADEARFEFQM